jgi:hypothetical protein
MENKYKEKYSEDVWSEAYLEIDEIISRISIVRKCTTKNIELLDHLLGWWSRSNFNPKVASYILQLIQDDIDWLEGGEASLAKGYSLSVRKEVSD